MPAHQLAPCDHAVQVSQRMLTHQSAPCNHAVQVSELLYLKAPKGLGVPVPAGTRILKRGTPSADEAALTQIEDSPEGRGIPTIIIQYRKLMVRVCVCGGEGASLAQPQGWGGVWKQVKCL